MFSHYVIEAGDQQAGLVILERGGFRFYAASPAFTPLEGRLFRSALDATRAAEGVARPRPVPAGAPQPQPYPDLACDGRVATSLTL
jgi:hypothetical protein